MKSASHLAAAVLAAGALTSTLGCNDNQPEIPTPRQFAIILDVSGSTAPAVDGYASRASELIAKQPDGTRIIVTVADGAAQSSLCIPRITELKAVGENSVDRQDSLDASRASAERSVADQIACGKPEDTNSPPKSVQPGGQPRANNTPGSDLIGSLLAVDTKLKKESDPTQIVMFSDGLQASRDLTLTAELLGDTTALDRSVQQLPDILIPTKMASAELTISDPAAGTVLTAQEARGVLHFWTTYAARARATLTT
jgi:hypothetical protein